MIKEIEELIDEYKTVKESGNELSMKEFKKIIHFKNKLDETIAKMKIIILSLNEAETYSNSISTAREKLQKQLDNLEIMKQTL